MKPKRCEIEREITPAATFGWLCVETLVLMESYGSYNAATFGWLCVETALIDSYLCYSVAATFGWLCVETSD